METVAIGCRLPNGYTLEVGLQTTVEAANGAPMVQVKRLANYARFVLGGTHAHTLKARRAGIQMPNLAGAEPYISRNVPKALWDEWKKIHAKDWVLVKGHIFEVPGRITEDTVRAASLDAAAQGPQAFQPIDPTKKMKFENNTVEARTKDKED